MTAEEMLCRPGSHGSIGNPEMLEIHETLAILETRETPGSYIPGRTASRLVAGMEGITGRLIVPVWRGREISRLLTDVQ
jgi:hypothetical protein